MKFKGLIKHILLIFKIFAAHCPKHEHEIVDLVHRYLQAKPDVNN